MNIGFACGNREIALKCWKILKNYTNPILYLFSERGEFTDEIAKTNVIYGRDFLNHDYSNIDMLICVRFPYIFPKNITDKVKIINLHPGYLPYNKGVNTPSWAIMDKNVAGVTMHQIDSGIDTGGIIARWIVPYEETDNADQLYKKLEIGEEYLFKTMIPKITSGNYAIIPQEEGGTFYRRKDLTKIARIDKPDNINQLLALSTNNISQACFFEKNGIKYHIKIEMLKELPPKAPWGFIIPSFRKEQAHNDLLEKCIASIRKFHATIPIVIIDDWSTIDIDISDPHIIIEKSPVKGAGDMVTLYMLLKYKYFDKAVIMQDSMFLEAPIKNVSTDNVQFLWHATNHIKQWHQIKEPQDDYNKFHKIVTHQDFILHMTSIYATNDLQNIVNSMINRKELWNVCFCLCMIIDLKFLELLESKTGITGYLCQLNTNRRRRTSESVFSMACSYILGCKPQSIEGLYFDGTNTPKGRDLPSPMGHKYCVKGKTFSKITLNRRR